MRSAARAIVDPSSRPAQRLDERFDVLRRRPIARDAGSQGRHPPIQENGESHASPLSTTVSAMARSVWSEADRSGSVKHTTGSGVSFTSRQPEVTSLRRSSCPSSTWRRMDWR